MQLNERKVKILQAIIKDYTDTAEPVGSRTIAKKYNLGVSSATIRNEMSDLEEMGLIVQPHASAGRIPSDKGYRYYVDSLVQKNFSSEDDESYIKYIKEIIANNINQIDHLMEETAKALSALTNYTTFISEPVVRKTKLKQVRLLPLDDISVMLVVATGENHIKNYIIPTQESIDDTKLNEMSNSVNDLLKGKNRDDMTDEVIRDILLIIRDHQELFKPMLKDIKKTIISAESVQVHLSGEKNMLSFPEFSDVDTARILFKTLEEKQALLNIIGEGTDGSTDVSIGGENELEEMKNCSVIKTSYKVGNDIYGTIGIIGPTRMDYAQVISVLNGMAKNIENVMNSIAKRKNKAIEGKDKLDE
ncbi:Heat-inducible transcription repressor HrcA [bioreactor metagenome]|uniref:Heat-inducible transcription repressor HrcA n=1 Tax=bioreactor metagenome TaxID=1076179 RepID=A0A645AL55_9ZZZZ|nr:heat-inducible transcriptional repressor HrcA [Candidatus Metalachnospira sp.]